jgi:hypothetical protein
MSGVDHIWAWSLDTTDRDSRPTTETGWEHTDHDAKWFSDRGKPLTEYVRRDPAVLAALPEVQALADDLASCIAMIQHAIGADKDVFIEPDTGKKLSDAQQRLEAFRAAAIRAGGKP